MGCYSYLLVLLALPFSAAAGEHYESYRALARREREGRDYRVTVLDRRASVLVMAIHGGTIEPGSGELAKDIAGTRENLYLFEALRSERIMNLHVTSTHFDDRRLFRLAARTDVCVSLHGFTNPAQNHVCLGGRNAPLVAELFARLQATGLLEQDEANPCQGFYALEPESVVNRCRNNGVQIEMSSKLREKLMADPAARLRFVEAVRGLSVFRP